MVHLQVVNNTVGSFPFEFPDCLQKKQNPDYPNTKLIIHRTHRSLLQQIFLPSLRLLNEMNMCKAGQKTTARMRLKETNKRPKRRSGVLRSEV